MTREENEISELHRAINALESEVTAQRSRAKKAELEAERLRAIVPSDDELSSIRWALMRAREWHRTECDYSDDTPERLRPGDAHELDEWLARVDAAKNIGDHG